MSNEKAQYATKKVTIRGKALWAKVITPDTKFNPEGTYEASVKVPTEEAEALINDIYTPLLESAVETAIDQGKFKPTARNPEPKKADLPFKYEVDEDGEDTGFVIFKGKMKASGTSKDGRQWHMKPKVYDAHKKYLENPPEIWNGSDIKIALELRAFYVPALGAGVSSRLQAVQIIELAEGGASSGDDFGFDDEEEGYTGSNDNNNNNNNKDANGSQQEQQEEEEDELFS